MAKNLELNIIVRTIDEATETIKRIKRDAVRQVSGSGSGAERDALRGAREDMAAMRQANRARDQQFQQRVARRKREDKFDADQDALKARLYQEYLDDVAAMGKRHAAAERSRQVAVAKEAESQDALKARLYREFLADKAKMEERHAAESRRRRAKEAADTIRDANVQRARMQMYRFQMMDVAMSMRAISTEAFIIGGAMTAIGVGLARTSLEIGGILARFEAGTTVMLRSAERAKSLGAEVRQFIVLSPFKTAEGVEAARRAIAAGFSPDTLVQDLTSIGNVVGGTGGTDVTFANMTKELGKINNQQVLYLRNMTRLVNNSIPAWRLLLAGMNARGLKVTNEQLSVMVDRRLIPAKQAIRDILRGADVLFPGMMSRMLDVDPLAQWAVTFDHFILTLTNLTEPLRKWLLETLKAINAVLSQMPQNLRGIIPILFSLGVASNIVFGGMLLALSGILYMGQMVLLMFAAWPSIVGQLGLGTGASIGAVLTAAKARASEVVGGVSAVVWKAGAGATAKAKGVFTPSSTMASMLSGADSARRLATIDRSAARLGMLESSGAISKKAAAKWAAKLDALYGADSAARAAAASPLKNIGVVEKSANASAKVARSLGVLGRIVAIASKVVMIAAATAYIASNWTSFDRETKAIVGGLVAAVALIAAMRIGVFLLKRGLLASAIEFAVMWALTSKIVDAWPAMQPWVEKHKRLLTNIAAIVATIYATHKAILAVQAAQAAISAAGGWRQFLLVFGTRSIVAIVALVGYYIGQWAFGLMKFNRILGATILGVTMLAGLIVMIYGALTRNLPIFAIGAALALGPVVGAMIEGERQRPRRPRQEATPERRASGGPVTAGKFYLVGEDGPELLATNTNGYVIPRARMTQLAASTVVPAGVGSIPLTSPSSMRAPRSSSLIGMPSVPANPSRWSLTTLFPFGSIPLTSPSSMRAPRSSSLIGMMQNVAAAAISAKMPSVPANPSRGSLTTLFPFLNVGGFGNAVRAFNGGGSTDIYTEEEGDEIVIRVKRNSFGDMASAGRGLVFR